MCILRRGVKPSFTKYTLVQDNAFWGSFQKYHNVTQLSRAMLVELIKEIRVYEGGRLEISLNFQDELQALTDSLELNQEAGEKSSVK